MSETNAPAAVRSIARVATPHASRYLQQLCKHFAHKLPVTFDEHHGAITFTIGEVRLDAREGVLEMHLTAPDAETMPQLQDVVWRHLVRFAFREELAADWQPA
ncbi:DUF2218 domain-containing protein [Antarcticirhabdus aurantiaca]|uniref:DUF2218 domain-containing protein n=1 Tax=Antarcticirhabdus aurantiaca TaxID=2606717 RepID=A0ACD4NPS9_9HYPH|nr:DUF2218 domain-containing protein [Antarcticirhabdus aurantiaca]WAJ28696.1 DUF2218 domain-containing protein [Jeongeuplla avenae]